MSFVIYVFIYLMMVVLFHSKLIQSDTRKVWGESTGSARPGSRLGGLAQSDMDALPAKGFEPATF